MFHNIGPIEIGIILVIVLIIFGVGKLPSVGGAIGKGIREFRKAVRGESDTKETDSESPNNTEDKVSRN